MSFRLITEDVPTLDPEGQCAKCDEIFPFVNILQCRQQRKDTKADLPLCLKCHQRLHVGCTAAQSLLTSRHYECSLCNYRPGVLVCAMCTLDDEPTDEILEGVLMCRACSDQVHSVKQFHNDHFYPVATQCIIPVMGTMRWENVPESRSSAFRPDPETTAMTARQATIPRFTSFQVPPNQQLHFRTSLAMTVQDGVTGLRQIVIGNREGRKAVTDMSDISSSEQRPPKCQNRLVGRGVRQNN